MPTQTTMKSALALALFFLSLPALSLPAFCQQVAFTFDDLPSTGDQPPGQTRLQIVYSILHTLHVEHMPPIYGFINAQTLVDSPEEIRVLKAWRVDHQPLGNHTYSHFSINEHTVADYTADIAHNEPRLRALTTGTNGGPNHDWHWFRYPYLQEGETLEKRDAVRAWLTGHGYRIAQVSLDFEDYLWNDPYARCLAKHDKKSIEYLRTTYLATADQSITIFHDLDQTLYGHDIKYVLLMHIGGFDAKMLPALIKLFRDRGFTFITLEDAMSDPAYLEDPHIALENGGAFQEQLMAARQIKFSSTKPYKELEALCR